MLRALGIAYYKTGRWDDASCVLTRAHERLEGYDLTGWRGMLSVRLARGL